MDDIIPKKNAALGRHFPAGDVPQPLEALDREPIDIQAITKLDKKKNITKNETDAAEAVKLDIKERFKALATLYGGENEHSFWRGLAINLAINYVPAFEIKIKNKKQPLMHWQYYLSMQQYINYDKLSVKEAAKRVVKDYQHAISQSSLIS